MQLNGMEPVSILTRRREVPNDQSVCGRPMVGRNEAIHFGHLIATVAIGFAYGSAPAKSVAAGALCIGLPSAYFAWIFVSVRWSVQNFGPRCGEDVE